MTITRRGLTAGAAALAATGLARGANAARTAPTPILLIHGAWHGAWCWSGLIPLLEAQGNRKVAAIDLTACGADRTPASEATLERDAQRIVAALGQFDRPALLLGHSFGGMSISAAAEIAPERIKSMIYLAAFLPANGESAFDLSGHNTGNQVGTAAKAPANGVVELDREKAIDVFYNGVSPELARAAASHVRPQPLAPLGGKVALTEARWGKLPKTYVRCDLDRAITPAFADWMVARRPEVNLKTMNTGHSPFLADPEGLARLIEAV